MISLPRYQMLAWTTEIDRELHAKVFKHHPFITHVTPSPRCHRASSANSIPHSDEISTYSWRSNSAMALRLAGVPVSMMMLIGRWSSEAFMVYIQPQVKEFATNVSAKMIQQEPFYIIPAYATIFSGANSNTSH